MLVYLRNNWATKYGRFKKSVDRSDLREIPDDLRLILPKSAELMNGGEYVPMPGKKDPMMLVKAGLHLHDFDRAAGEAEDKFLKKADEGEMAKKQAAQARMAHARAIKRNRTLEGTNLGDKILSQGGNT